MDEILEKNLRALKTYREELYGLIMSGDPLDSVYSQGVASSSENVDGRMILFAVRNEQLYLLESSDPTVELYDKWAGGLDQSPDSKYALLGFGNGSISRKILAGLQKNGMLLVYEPDLKLFAHVIENYDVSDILSDTRLLFLYHQLETDQEKDLFHILGSNIEYTDIDSLVISDYPNYRTLYPYAWEYFKGKTDEVIGAVVANRDVLKRFGKAFVENTFANFSFFRDSKSLVSLVDRFPSDVPVIVVSSGPSLNKNIDQLKKAKGHALILSADSAVSVLLKAGITPDMYFCVDAKKNPGHFEHEGVGDIPMGCELDTAVAAFKDRRAHCFFAGCSNPHIDGFLDDEGIVLFRLDTGGSVANTATDFALKLGAKRIILVGQDLAYTGNKSHAEGSLRASWNMDLSKNECLVEGQDGESVRSSSEFVRYRNWFERVIDGNKDVRFINATEGGAKIHGAEQMSLSDAVSEFCNVNFDAASFLDEADELLTSDQKADFDAFIMSLDKEIDSLSEQIGAGIKSYTEMYKLATDNKQGNPRFKKLYDKTREIGNILNTSGAMYYIENMVQEDMTSLMDKHSQDRKSEKSRLLADIESGIEYFKIVKKGVSDFRGIRRRK